MSKQKQSTRGLKMPETIVLTGRNAEPVADLLANPTPVAEAMQPANKQRHTLLGELEESVLPATAAANKSPSPVPKPARRADC